MLITFAGGFTLVTIRQVKEKFNKKDFVLIIQFASSIHLSRQLSGLFPQCSSYICYQRVAEISWTANIVPIFSYNNHSEYFKRYLLILLFYQISLLLLESKFFILIDNAASKYSKRLTSFIFTVHLFEFCNNNTCRKRRLYPHFQLSLTIGL